MALSRGMPLRGTRALSHTGILLSMKAEGKLTANTVVVSTMAELHKGGLCIQGMAPSRSCWHDAFHK